MPILSYDSVTQAVDELMKIVTGDNSLTYHISMTGRHGLFFL